MAKLISKTYADALFELAIEENQTVSFRQEVESLQQILRDNEEFHKFMNHPKIPKEEKKAALENIFHGRIDNELLGFLITIVDKDRYGKIEEILDTFIAEVKEYNHIGTVDVTTAVDLSAQEKEDIEKRLLDTTDYEQIECNYTVDPTLIGGMIIRIGDRVVDSSIRTKLDKMERELMAIQLV